MPLVVMPVLVGGARPWLWAGVAAVFFVGLAALRWVDPSLFTWKVRGKWLWLLGLLMVWPFLQALPMPQSWLAACSPQRLAWLHDVGRAVGYDGGAASISWAPLPTLMGGFFWVFLAAFAWLFWLTEKAEGLLSWLWNLLFLLAGLEALYGLIQVLVPDVGVLWFASESYRGMARGTFINKNHYAAFLGMLWPLLLARVLTLRDGPPQRAEFPLRELSYTEKERRKQTKHKQLFLSFIIGLVLLAIVFSQSRGGAVAVLIAMTVFTLVGKTRRKGLLAAVVGLWVVVLSYGAIMGFDAVLERFNRMEDDAPGRFQVWQDTVRIMGDYPWTGTGLGTYPATIRVYQTSLPANIDYVHAHGDYFEIASELGLPAAMLLMLLVWGFWWNRAWRLVRRASLESGGGAPGDRERKRLIGVGALAGCAAFLCHSIVEFNWQIPANQLYFVTLLMLMRSGGWERVYGNE